MKIPAECECLSVSYLGLYGLFLCMLNSSREMSWLTRLLSRPEVTPDKQTPPIADVQQFPQAG
jgi:hypothetical protein